MYVVVRLRADRGRSALPLELVLDHGRSSLPHARRALARPEVILTYVAVAVPIGVAVGLEVVGLQGLDHARDQALGYLGERHLMQLTETTNDLLSDAACLTLAVGQDHIPDPGLEHVEMVDLANLAILTLAPFELAVFVGFTDTTAADEVVKTLDECLVGRHASGLAISHAILWIR